MAVVILPREILWCKDDVASHGSGTCEVNFNEPEMEHISSAKPLLVSTPRTPKNQAEWFNCMLAAASLLTSSRVLRLLQGKLPARITVPLSVISQPVKGKSVVTAPIIKGNLGAK